MRGQAYEEEGMMLKYSLLRPLLNDPQKLEDPCYFRRHFSWAGRTSNHCCRYWRSSSGVFDSSLKKLDPFFALVPCYDINKIHVFTPLVSRSFDPTIVSNTITPTNCTPTNCFTHVAFISHAFSFAPSISASVPQHSIARAYAASIRRTKINSQTPVKDGASWLWWRVAPVFWCGSSH